MDVHVLGGPLVPVLAVSDLGAGFTRGERDTGIEFGPSNAPTGMALGVVPTLDDLTTNEASRATGAVGLGLARAGLALHGVFRIQAQSVST